MKDSVKNRLLSIVGKDRGSDSPTNLAAYSYDAYFEEHPPELVLFPLTTEEVSAIMSVAHEEKIPVTARGSGTNLAGESVPVRGGVALCLSKMDKIVAVDPGNLTAVTEPGVINLDLQEAVGRLGLMYPPDPASWSVATMGGTVATNAGGPRTLKYGVTKDYLLGLTVVLANGEVLKTGGRTLKNVSGYNLTSLFCGSEGTLGIITLITLRLIPKPRATQTIRADFASVRDCSEAVAAIMSGGIVPAALELMDRFAVRAVNRSFDMGLPEDAEGLLLTQLDGDPETLPAQAAIIERAMREKNAREVILAEDPTHAERLWAARRAAGPALMRMSPNLVTEDVTVPVSRLPEMMEIVNRVCARHRIQVGVIAHAGDGNLHPCMLFDKRNNDEYRRVQAVCEELASEAIALGGTLSGEHGIGLAKAPFLGMEMDPVALRVMRGVKEYFDPQGILNPGKFV